MSWTHECDTVPVLTHSGLHRLSVTHTSYWHSSLTPHSVPGVTIQSRQSLCSVHELTAPLGDGALLPVSRVGAPLGAPHDGEVVGDDGDAVGDDVVGEWVGDSVGDDVAGELVGDRVGDDVVGESVGDCVGDDVVGESVGNRVGEDVVGESVEQRTCEMVLTKAARSSNVLMLYTREGSPAMVTSSVYPAVPPLAMLRATMVTPRLVRI